MIYTLCKECKGEASVEDFDGIGIIKVGCCNCNQRGYIENADDYEVAADSIWFQVQLSDKLNFTHHDIRRHLLNLEFTNVENKVRERYKDRDNSSHRTQRYIDPFEHNQFIKAMKEVVEVVRKIEEKDKIQKEEATKQGYIGHYEGIPVYITNYARNEEVIIINEPRKAIFINGETAKEAVKKEGFNLINKGEN